MRVLYPYAITDATLTAASEPEADYPAWSAANAYAVGDRVVYLHRIYQRLTAGTTSTAPLADDLSWEFVAPTNRWSMFDDSAGTSTTAAGSLSVTIAPGGSVADIVLMGVVGSTVTVYINGALSRVVTVAASDMTGVGSTVAITGLTATGSPSIQIIVTGPGTVAVATCCLGTFYALGNPETGPQISRKDFSIKEFGKYGGLTITPRPYNRQYRGNFTLAPAGLDTAARLLTALRGRLAIWQGLTWVDASLLYGYVTEWRLVPERGLVRGSIALRSLALGA